MEKADIDTYARNDLHYIQSIGGYVRKHRLTQNMTQQSLADAAGINRTTLSQLEKGKPVNVLSLIQVLRALKKLEILQEFEIKPQLSPLQLAAIEQKQRQRAGRKKDKTNRSSPGW